MFKKATKYDYQGKFKPALLSQNNIDRLSTALVPKNSKVLELGCSTGFMSQYFKNKKNCRVYGVDKHQKAIKMAAKYCQTAIWGDLEKNHTWNKIKKNRPYDLVFASSVIEHLSNPEQILLNIKSVLKPGGILIMTTPNVAHWRTRFNLLCGKWQYQDYGILDKTHLKFFSYYSFINLIKNAGFKIKKVKIDPAGGIKYLNFIAKYFPNFYAHQIVIKAGL